MNKPNTAPLRTQTPKVRRPHLGAAASPLILATKLFTESMLSAVAAERLPPLQEATRRILNRLQPLAAALVLLIVGTASSSAGPLPAPARTITADELIRHVQYLADDDLEGRESGHKGAVLAAKYVALEFEKYGLTPAGTNESWFQDFQVDVGLEIGPGNHLVSRIDGAEKRHELHSDFLPYGVRKSGPVSGSLVFAGYGIRAPDLGYDDYRDIEIRGKLVLLLRYEPQKDDPKSPFDGKENTSHATLTSKLALAAELGAAAVLLVDASAERRPVATLPPTPLWIPPQDKSIPIFSVDYPVAAKWLQAAGHDLAGLVAQIDSDLRPRSFTMDQVQVDLNVDLIARTAPSSNVLGFLPGSDQELRDQLIVVGAHIDHLGYGPAWLRQPRTPDRIHNGADDNASGVAAMLEIAEAFALAPVAPLRSLLFVGFSGEEKGSLGSSNYVEQPFRPLSNTVAMINLDMVGRARNGLNVQGVGTSPGFKALIEVLSEDFSLMVSTTPSGLGPSDHRIFCQREVPVMQFFTGYHDDYHQPTDDWRLVHFPEAEQVTQLVWRCIERLANDRSRPTFTKSDTEPPRSGWGGQQLGILADPEFKHAGIKVQQVVAGMPAEKGGVLPNDLIVRIDRRPVENRRDLIAYLEDRKGGETVDLVVVRVGQEHTLSVAFPK